MTSKTPREEETRNTKEATCSFGPGTGIPGGGETSLSDHDILCALVTSMVQGNRRWQMVVFPSLFAFVLLAAYGFYLIFSLVEDVDRMATSVYLNLGFMSERMGQISQNIDALTSSVRDISVNLDDLTGTVTAMNATVVTISGQMRAMPPMLDAMRDVNLHIAAMDQSMQSLDGRVGTMTASVQTMNNQMAAITAATQHISGNVSGMNQSIGRPMNFMNKIMPW
ncbi:MAG: hypothetical protein U9Q81_11370 [Pseudomonadota bacterium]|nr:hypothetical protein [Pseudomonadota bacterium]